MTDSLPPTPTTPPPAKKQTLMERWKALLPEYGKIALTTYFSIFFLVLAGFTIAIRLGFRPEEGSATGWAGTMAGAYAATKLTQPLRILATLGLTPVIAKIVRR